MSEDSKPLVGGINFGPAGSPFTRAVEAVRVVAGVPDLRAELSRLRAALEKAEAERHSAIRNADAEAYGLDRMKKERDEALRSLAAKDERIAALAEEFKRRARQPLILRRVSKDRILDKCAADLLTLVSSPAQSPEAKP